MFTVSEGDVPEKSEQRECAMWLTMDGGEMRSELEP